MIAYILATIVVPVVKWVALLFFTMLYVAVGFHNVSPLFPWKQEVGKALSNACSNLVAIYALVSLLNKLHMQSTVAMLIPPTLIGLAWSHFNIRRARIGVAPHSQIRPIFDDYRERVKDEFSEGVAEAIAGEEAFRGYLLRSEYAELVGDILGIILAAIMLLRGAPLM